MPKTSRVQIAARQPKLWKGLSHALQHEAGATAYLQQAVSIGKVALQRPHNQSVACTKPE